jgi:hypothetical protein
MWLFYPSGPLQTKLKAEDPFISRTTMATGFPALPLLSAIAVGAPWMLQSKTRDQTLKLYLSTGI